MLSKYTRSLKSPKRGEVCDTPKRNFVVSSEDLFKIKKKEHKQMRRDLNI